MAPINRPGTDNPVAAFFSQAIPAIVSMLLTSCIVVVDGLFVGRVIGSTGLAAVNLTVPVLYVFLGITIMIAVGGSTLALHGLGGGDHDGANRLFSGTLLAVVVAAAVLIALLTIFRESVLSFLGARGETYAYTRRYLSVMLWFYLFSMINIGFTIFIRAEGKPELTLAFGLAGNLINILFDWLFIVVLDMELTGAALASGIAALVPTALALRRFLSGKSLFRFRKPSLSARELGTILGNGSSEMISQFSFSITTYLFNTVTLSLLGVAGVAAFTIIGYVSFLQSMVVTGLGIGLAPVVGFAWGAGDSPTIRKVLKAALVSSFAAGVFWWAVAFLAGGSIVSAFDIREDALMTAARTGFVMLSIAFLMNGINMTASAFFTSIGDARTSAIISVLRGLLLISVFVLVLPRFFGATGIWLSVPITEFCTLLYTVPMLMKKRKTLVKTDAGKSAAA